MDAHVSEAETRLLQFDKLQLSQGRVHEVLDDASDAFAVIAARLSEGPVFWIGVARDVRSLSASGLSAYTDCEKIFITETVDRRETLWAGEQALASNGASCVIIQLHDGPDLKESRRLQIAAEKGGGLGLILISGHAHTSAAQTRWHCKTTPSLGDPFQPSWAFEITKNKNGRLQKWRAHWQEGAYGTGAVHLAAGPSS